MNNKELAISFLLWWLLGISVQKLDEFALDCFIFPELWYSKIKECKSIPCICMHHAEASTVYFYLLVKGDRKEVAFKQSTSTTIQNAISSAIAVSPLKRLGYSSILVM